LRPLLVPLVDALLADPDMGWQEFRGLAMLLDRPGLNDLLARMTAAAAESDDLDVREVAEDFPASGPHRRASQ
jgi:hypothetical protein